MPKVYYPLAVGLLLSLAIPAAAQDSSNSANEMDDRLDALKADLLDATAGYYVSPSLTLSGVAAELDAGAVELDADGVLVRGGVAIGYQSSPVRVEAGTSIGYLGLDVDVGGDNQQNDIITFDLVLNTFYDVPLDLGAYISDAMPEIRPYIGAGLGWTYFDPDAGASDSGISGQGAAGIGIRLSPHWTLDAGYRYFYFPRIEFDGLDSEPAAHTAEARVRYRL